MSSTAIIRAFPSDYTVKVLRDYPGDRGTHVTFAQIASACGEAVLFAVTSKNGTWDGLVAPPGTWYAGAKSGIFTTPHPSTLCVIARGDAYFIHADDPSKWLLLEDSPIVAVRCAVAEGVLVLATPWYVVAMGADGETWRTPRIAIEGLELHDPGGGTLTGVADPDDRAAARMFSLDLRTGAHTGGAPLEAWD